MPIKLSDLQKRTKTIEVEFQGEKVNITYLINAVTPAFLSERVDVVGQVKATVTEWDVLDDDGNKLPVTESADLLSLDFHRAVISAIVEDMRGVGGEEEKKG